MNNKIEISITHGKLENFTVHIDNDGKKDINAVIGLYTDGERKISSFSIDTRNYYGQTKIEFPTKTLNAIKKICEELELITILKCREHQLSLNAPQYDF
jgi:hypothetical protein